MADVNVYTAARLGDMAASLSRLAQSFTEEMDGKHLTKEDGAAAMQTAAAMVCGSCSRCNLYQDSAREDSYYLHYLLRAFEVHGAVRMEDMPLLFRQTCFHKEKYLNQLNSSLGRATMNLSWKNRFLESRDAVVVQFRELASIIEEFSRQMEQAADITEQWQEGVRRLFRRHHMLVENMLILEYENRQREAYLTVRTTHGACLTAREAAGVLGQAMGRKRWYPARDSKAIVTRQSGTLRFVEEGKYQMLYGISRRAKEGEAVSGDSYTFFKNLEGQVIMSLADGMGSGERACMESCRIIDLTEQLIQSGFTARSSLKLVNTVLLLAGKEQHPAAMDVVCVDLNTGVLEAMKLGAAASFVMGRDGVELLEAGDVPIGVLNPIEPVLLSKKLWDDDRIVMVSDGVLDALPGENKEEAMTEFLTALPPGRPQEIAEQVMDFALSSGGAVRDDMTVFTAGIWERG
ncbi:MAG: SpoIIE family protein phosphatase [Lachnospiraceae bacterium]|nr:SpoIIE family protein phosphatase [Lachnospiraceae bacterium]